MLNVYSARATGIFIIKRGSKNQGIENPFDFICNKFFEGLHKIQYLEEIA
jgi:hypothetical protein